MLRLLVAAAVILLWVPSASAATFGLQDEPECGRGGCTTARVAAFVGGPGETNGVTVRRLGADVIARDDGSPLAAGPGCRPVDAAAVACPADVRRVDVSSGDGADVVYATVDELAVVVRLGDGDDRFTGTAVAYGGAGADELRGAERPVSFDGGVGDDILVGGAAADELIGGPGADALLGEAGDDVLNAGDVIFDATGKWVRDAPAGDRVDGGPGRDRLSYFARKVGTLVDLAAGQAGIAGESDRVTNAEDVVGGYGDDRIRGDDGPNRLDGYFGSDLIDGRSGDDWVHGGTGVDDRSVLIGGPGDDELTALGAARLLDGGPGDDTLRTPLVSATERCGPGDDVLIWDGGPIVARPDGCERIDASAVVIRPPARLHDDRVSFRLFCRTSRPARTCRTTLTITNARGRPTRTLRRRIASRTSRTLSLHLPRALRQRSRAYRIRPLHVTVTVRSGTDGPRTRVRLELTWVRA